MTATPFVVCWRKNRHRHSPTFGERAEGTSQSKLSPPPILENQGREVVEVRQLGPVGGWSRCEPGRSGKLHADAPIFGGAHDHGGQGQQKGTPAPGELSPSASECPRILC
ncbi:unnamed protein product, partial [Ectocarpus sp. 12 AP-2014]